MNTPRLQIQDPDVYAILMRETKRQKEGMELIPSENYVSPAVLETMGTIFTNKYSEGYPGKRYYGGQEFIDQIENLAIERAKKLFPVDHVNVQPYSGSPANSAIYFALLNYGDTVMGLKLDHGGHITHGLPISFSGRSYNFVPYLANEETGYVEMDQVRKIALECKPKMIVMGATAYPRTVDFDAFRTIADEVGAILMADVSHIIGLIIGKQHPTPFPFTDVVMTTTHKTFRGPRGAMIMCKEQYAKDIDRAVFPGMQGGPHEHAIAAKAVAFEEAARPEFQTYAAQIVKNAHALADAMMALDFKLVTKGTDNHLILADLTNKNVTGKEMQNACDIVGISLNKNTVPGDKRSPFDPSGIRLGTPAISTRGMKEEHMSRIAGWLQAVVENVKDEEKLKVIQHEVSEFCLQFPVPGIE